MYTGLGSFSPARGAPINTPLSIDGQSYSDWKTLPQDLDKRRVLDASGRQVAVQSFLGGFLVDGCPLNVVYGGPWIDGQQDALRAGGFTSCLPVTEGVNPSGQRQQQVRTAPTKLAPQPYTFTSPPFAPVATPPFAGGVPGDIYGGFPSNNAPAPASGMDINSMLPWLIGGAVLVVLLARR